MCSAAGTDGPGGARDPYPEPSHVQQQTEELQAGSGEAGERLCKYFSSTTSTTVHVFFVLLEKRKEYPIKLQDTQMSVLFFSLQKKSGCMWQFGCHPLKPC